MPIRSFLLALFATTLFAASTPDEAKLIVRGELRGSSWRLNAGNAVALDSIRLKGIPDNDEKRDLNKQAGIHVGVERAWWKVGVSHLGWVQCLGLSYDRHRGDDRIGAGVYLNDLALTYRAGLVMRWHSEYGNWLGHEGIQIELAPTLSVGGGFVDYNNQPDSGWGATGKLGARLDLIGLVRGNFLWSAAFGYEAGRAYLDWDNTDGASVDLGGPYLRLGAGWRF
jgi:hypothetical protein